MDVLAWMTTEESQMLFHVTLYQWEEKWK